MGARIRWVVAASVLAAGSRGAAQQPGAASTGRKVFEEKCAACHSLGADRTVGPGLSGVTARRSRDWLARWILAPSDVLAGGDSIARRLLAESNGMAMPTLSLTPGDVSAVIEYLGSAGSSPVGAAAPAPPAVSGDPAVGGALFQGAAAFANHGATCNSCHDVRADSVVAGGALAPDLTTAYTRLGDAGIQGILSNPPFPVMQRAYRDHPLSTVEIANLVAFLKRADERHGAQPPGAFGLRLLGAGAGGSLLLLGLYALAWGKRMKASVNQSIYDRQTTSI